MAQAANEPTAPAVEAHPVLTPFRRGLSLLAELRDIRDHLYVAGKARTGPRTEDGEALSTVLFDMVRRVERACEEQGLMLSAMTAAERKEAAAAPTQEREARRAARSRKSGFHLEGAIGDVVNATIVLEAMAEDAIGTLGGQVEQHIKNAVPDMGGYHIFVLTEDQSRGLDYAIFNVGNLARALESKYLGEEDDGNVDIEEAAGDA